MTLAIALTLTAAGCVSVVLECTVAGSLLLGAAVLYVRYCVA